MRHIQTAGEGVDIRLLAQRVLGDDHSPHASIELAGQHLERETRGGLQEGYHHGLVIRRLEVLHECNELGVVVRFVIGKLLVEGVDYILRGQRRSITPHGILADLDGQLREVRLGISHALCNPGSCLTGIDHIVRQAFIQQ